MITDVATMIWKEWRELLRQRGSWKAFLVGLFVPVAVFGIMLPIQAGVDWLETPISLSAWIYMPTVLVMTMMADSIAGERERHTLETLLATRLPDQAILYGKILAGVGYALLLALAIVAVGLVSVNLTDLTPGWQWYNAQIFWGGLAISLLLSLLGSVVGVLISLRAASVRQATQTLSYIMLVVFFLPVVLLQILPRQVMVTLEQTLAPLTLEGVLLVGGAAVLLVDLALLALARARFRRTRLTLD